MQQKHTDFCPEFCPAPTSSFTAELARWALPQLLLWTGCGLVIGWSDSPSGPIAAVVDTPPFDGRSFSVPGIKAVYDTGSIAASGWTPNPKPDQARRLGERLCHLLTATAGPLHRLAARGVPLNAALLLLWDLDQQASRARAVKPRRDRRQEARTLLAAAELLEQYRPDLEPKTQLIRIERPDQPRHGKVGRLLYDVAIRLLRWAASELPAMHSPRGRREDRLVLIAVAELDRQAAQAGAASTALEIAALVKAAWPERCTWGENNDDAARKLLARAREWIAGY